MRVNVEFLKKGRRERERAVERPKTPEPMMRIAFGGDWEEFGICLVWRLKGLCAWEGQGLRGREIDGGLKFWRCAE